MISVLEGRTFAAADEFVKELNKARLANKNKWIVCTATVEGKEVQIKAYNTGYLQIFRIDGREQAAPMDMSISAWKEFILNAFAKYR